MADTVIQVKSSSGWKFKVALGIFGLVTIIVLAFTFRIEAGIIVLACGLAGSLRIAAWAIHQNKLSKYEARRLEAETQKLEYEAVKAKAESYFIETVSGVFTLQGIAIDRFYPSATASKSLADAPLLLPASTETTSYRRLLDVDFIHLLIVGPSGAGKTTVLCHLIDNAPNNTLIYALDPHSQFNEWPNRVNEIVGNGRNYGAINTKLIDLISTMNRRYNGLEPTTQKVLILADEWLGILDKCESAKDFFNTIGSEARKVNMNLVISSISATVDDLSVSGAIRDNLAQLTLSRTWQRQNLGELKWSRSDKEMVELPGPYKPVYQIPAKVEPIVQEQEFIDFMPILDNGPVAYAPSSEELKIYELHLSGMSLRKISQEVFGSTGGNQIAEIKAILGKFGIGG